MINPFNEGDTKEYNTYVTKEKIAEFDSGVVHNVYSTFHIAKDAEWACRLFVLEMKESIEEGIGVFISIHHISPAKIGSAIKIVAKLKSVQKNKVICEFTVFAQDRIIAKGEQIQKIIIKSEFDKYLETL